MSGVTNISSLQFKSVSNNPEMVQKLLAPIFKEILEPLYGSQDSALKNIETLQDRVCLIAYDQDVPVGVLQFKTVLSDEFAEYGISQSLELKTLFVIDSGRNSGKGIGSHLLEHVIKTAKVWKALSIHVTVSSKRPDSLSFFAKKGFQVKATFPKRYLPEADEHLLFLDLATSNKKAAYV